MEYKDMPVDKLLWNTRMYPGCVSASESAAELGRRLADAQATVEALQAWVQELEQPVYVCQGCGRLGRDGWLPTSFTSDELRGSVQCPDCGCIDREKNTARELAAICTKAQSELAQRTAELEALQAWVRDEFERERDQLHAALMEAKAALNIYRATLDASDERRRR